MGAQMLRDSQLLALGALACAGFVSFGVYCIWPDLYWWAYPLVGVLAAAAAYRPWADLVAEEKIIDRRLMNK